MPGATACTGIPYPIDTDPVDVAADMQAMAEALDSVVCGAAFLQLGNIVAHWDMDPSDPPPTGQLRCDGDTFDPLVYPALAAYLGTTTTPDLRGRFLRGADATYINGQMAGYADATVVTHTHGLNGHTHSINHNHGLGTTSSDTHNHSINHNHGSSTSSGAGGHNHSISGFGLDGSGATGSTKTILSDDGAAFNGSRNVSSVGSHTHAVNLPNYAGSSGSDSHNHLVDLPNYSGTSGGNSGLTASTGSTGINRNLPPFAGVTFLIQAI